MLIDSKNSQSKKQNRIVDPHAPSNRRHGNYHAYNNFNQYSTMSDKNQQQKGANFWKNRPTTNDYPKKTNIMKILIGVFIDGFIIAAGFYLEFSAITTIVLLVLNTVLYYLVAFAANFRSYSIKTHANLREIDLFANRQFFFNSDERDNLFVVDRTDRNVYGMFSLSVTRVPVNVGANISAVIRSLNQHNIPFTYQFHYGPKIQKIASKQRFHKMSPWDLKKAYDAGEINPANLTEIIINKINGSKTQLELSINEIEPKNSKKSCPTSEEINDYDLSVTFTFFSESRYFFDINGTISRLEKQLLSLYTAVQMLFLQDFSHYELKKLKSQELIDGANLRYQCTVDEFNIDPTEKSGYKAAVDSGYINKTSFKLIHKKTVLTLIYLTAISVIVSIFISQGLTSISNVDKLILFIILVTIVLTLCFVLSDVLTGMAFFNSNILDRTFLAMQSNVKYFQYTAYPDILFIHLLDYDLIFGVDEWVVNELPDYLHVDFQKFLRGILRSEFRFPLNMSLLVRPCSPRFFAENYINNVSPYIQRQIITDNGLDPERIKRQFMYQGGMCNITLLFESYTYLVSSTINTEICDIIGRKLDRYAINIENSIKSFLLYGEFHDIQSFRATVNAFLMHNMKSNQFFPHGIGTNFPIIPVGGKKVSNLIDLRGIIKRGLNPQLPVEFITPSNVKANVHFANLYNTEINRKDAKTGFLYQNFFESILIAGESSNALDLWNLTIMQNSMKNNIPFIVFDHSGNYTSLLNTVKDTQWKDDILILKLGENYSMNILHPETPNRIHDDKYVEELTDCFSIAYNLSTIENGLLRAVFYDLLADGLENLELSQISSSFESYIPKFGSRVVESVRAIFTGLTKSANITAFRTGTEYMPQFGDILYSRKTYIIDLSDLGLSERFLAQSVILLKIKNYLDTYWDVDPKKLSQKFQSLSDINGNDTDSQTDFDYSQYEELTKPVSKVVTLSDPISVLERNFNIKTPISEKYADMLKKLQKYDYGFIIRTEKPSKVSSFISEICQNYLGLRVTNYQNQQTFRTLFHLDETNGEGYSERRHQSYQQSFFTKLPDYIGIIKRKDIDFPYPVILDLISGISLQKPTYSEIKEHMKRIGYDIDYAYEIIESKASLTTLEQEFESHRRVLSHVVRYLEYMDELSNLSDVNITKQKCLRDLKEYLHEPLLQQLGNNRAASAARKSILALIINHGYLVQVYDSGVEGTANSRPYLKPQPKIRESIDEYHRKSRIYHTNDSKTFIDDTEEIDGEEEEVEDEFGFKSDTRATAFQRMYQKLIRDNVLEDVE